MIQNHYLKKDQIPLLKKAKQILIKSCRTGKNMLLYLNSVIVKLLEKGIAVHHSGVTPVFREMIEILYRKQYIKQHLQRKHLLLASM